MGSGCRTARARYDRLVHAPPLTITCDCGAAESVPYGERWRCGACGKTWDTAQIPRAEYEALLHGVRRYRLLVLGPPLLLAGVLVPLTIFSGVQFAFLLFMLVMAHALLVVPMARRRATARARERMPRWSLRPE